MATAKQVAVLICLASVLLPSARGWASEAAESSSTAGQTLGYSWRQTDGSLALLSRGRIVWQFNFDKKEGKPYFYPVCLSDETQLTWHRPPDHPWHYGLWFCWKYINGVNYWEEDRQTGLSEGRTEIQHADVKLHADYSADIVLNLSYHPPGAPPVLVEERKIHVSVPDGEGLYRIDWTGRFTAGAADVLLDRTPIQGEKDGQSWGGYAGLSMRFAKDISDWQLVDSEGRKDLAAHGKNARWMDFSGRFAQDPTAGVAIFDHPNNLRHPAPGFVIMDPKPPFGYFSPAVLFNKPYTLPAGQGLTLRYRILIHPGRLDTSALEREWQSFRKSIDVQSGARSQSDDATQEQLSSTHNRLQFSRQMPFGEAIEQIRNCVEPPLQIAVLWRDLYDNADIDRTTPINMDEISGVSIGTVLDLLLASVSGRYDQLDYTIDDGVIVIATVESLPNRLKPRVYDIADLL